MSEVLESGNINVNPVTEQPLDITVNQEITENVIEVLWQDEADVSVAVDITYIAAGKEEIEHYVETVSKPELDAYTLVKEQQIDDYVVEQTNNAKENIDEYVESDIKPELQVYVDSASNSANSANDYANEAKSWAVGDIEERPEGSAKNWAEQSIIQADKAETEANRAEAAADSIVPEKFADKSLVNTGMTSNCILEAPNGVASYVGGDYTLKAGVKMLIPNGLNADGTLRNIEYTLPTDLTISLSSDTPPVNGRIVFLEASGVLSYYSSDAVIIGSYPPASHLYNIWFDAKANMWKKNIGVIQMSPVALIKQNSVFPYNITSINNAAPIQLLKLSDIEMIGRASHLSNKILNLTLGVSGFYYRAPANGVFFLRKTTTKSGQYVQMDSTDNAGLFRGTIGTDASQFISVDYPCKKGDFVIVSYSAGGDTKAFGFIYDEGNYKCFME